MSVEEGGKGACLWSGIGRTGRHGEGDGEKGGNDGCFSFSFFFFIFVLFLFFFLFGPQTTELSVLFSQRFHARNSGFPLVTAIMRGCTRERLEEGGLKQGSGNGNTSLFQLF